MVWEARLFFAPCYEWARGRLHALRAFMFCARSFFARIAAGAYRWASSHLHLGENPYGASYPVLFPRGKLPNCSDPKQFAAAQMCHGLNCAFIGICLQETISTMTR